MKCINKSFGFADLHIDVSNIGVFRVVMEMQERVPFCTVAELQDVTIFGLAVSSLQDTYFFRFFKKIGSSRKISLKFQRYNFSRKSAY